MAAIIKVSLEISRAATISHLHFFAGFSSASRVTVL
jgi:hypothetical protein